MSNSPTKEQLDKTNELLSQGYIWDREKSISSAGVVLTKGDDLWWFGLNGEIMHNPDSITIKIS